MELNKMIFEITCSKEQYLQEVIDWYNRNYNTDFEVLEIIEEVEVIFVKIGVSKFKTTDIFDLGFHLGMKEEKLRSEGKIDW